jgi:lipid A 3-O-deacylase
MAAFFVRTYSQTGRNRTSTHTAKFLLMMVLGWSACIAALSQETRTQDDSPVAQVRRDRSWEYGPFVNFGNGLGGNRSQFWFFAAGAQLGKILTPPLHAGILSGQFELAGNIMPIWQAYTPAPHDQTFEFQGQTYSYPVGGGTYTGASITPVIFRWNFLTHSPRIQPWFQGAGGLIYTTHKFPPDILVPKGIPGGTSVWNFSPQGGIGVHYFTRPRRSIDFGFNAVHISSASLGDHNPGVNALWQIQLGDTYWKEIDQRCSLRASGIERRR